MRLLGVLRPTQIQATHVGNASRGAGVGRVGWVAAHVSWWCTDNGSLPKRNPNLINSKNSGWMEFGMGCF